MDKIALLFDKKNCMGCHACEVACKQEHDLGVGPRLVKVIEQSPNFIPLYCHHCARPPCGEACPVEAITRNDRGIVLIDGDVCIGCRECVNACPFGAMQYEEMLAVAVKCDLCADRLSRKQQPACMSVCPTGCIRFGPERSVAALFETNS